MTIEANEAFLHVQHAPAGPVTAGDIEAHPFTGDDYDRAMEAAFARGRWPELDRLLAPVVLRGLRSAVEAGDVSRPDGARVLAHLGGMAGRPGLGASAAMAALCKLQGTSARTRHAGTRGGALARANEERRAESERRVVTPLPSYPPRPRRSALDRLLAGLVRSLRDAAYQAAMPGRSHRDAELEIAAERREAVALAARRFLARFAAVRDAVERVHDANAGKAALGKLAGILASDLDRGAPSALQCAHETLLRFVDWIEGARYRPPRPRRPKIREPPPTSARSPLSCTSSPASSTPTRTPTRTELRPRRRRRRTSIGA